jgi:hypothetical protein
VKKNAHLGSTVKSLDEMGAQDGSVVTRSLCRQREEFLTIPYQPSCLILSRIVRDPGAHVELP